MKSTTALRKITALRKKIRVIQGGQGAGKTISILMILINHASGVAGREILIASSELTKMRLTVIKDFVTIMKDLELFNPRRWISGTLYRFPNGSFIKFIGLDQEDIGKGLRFHVFYLNEGNKVNFETYREAASRMDNIYIDFNPNAQFWVHEEVITREDCDFITITFQDNEALKESERDEILMYYKKGYDHNGNVISEYWANKWRVYGLGEIGSLQGAVWTDWSIIDEIPDGARLLGFGCDFGFTNSVTAVIAVYEWRVEIEEGGKKETRDRYVFDEWIFDTGMINRDIAQMMSVMGYDGAVMYCDYAEPKSIASLQRDGINAHPCESKTDIREYAIDKLNQDHFYITRRSEGSIQNLQSYVWAETKTGERLNKPKKENDHFGDAVIYFVGTEDKYDGTY